MKKVILNKINEFLLQHWDPIGIGSDPSAYDEYELYVKDIYLIIFNSQSYQELFDYLRRVETENIGLEGDIHKTKEIAQTLYNTFKIQIRSKN